MRSFRLCLLAAILVAALATSAFSRTWYIRPDGTGDAPTIQAGVDSAAASDIVLVAAGTYSSTSSVLIDGMPKDVVVAISKDIRLLSESGPASTTIDGSAADIGIYFDGVGSTTEVRGFRIRTVFEPFGCVDSQVRSSPPLVFLIGIKCRNAAPRISNNEITENGIGIDLNASPALIVENQINLSFYGVICSSGSDANISDNVIHHCAEHVRSEASAPLIMRNEMYEGCVAVYCIQGSSAVIAENVIHDNGPLGVECGGLSEAVIENNRFYKNRMSVLLTGTGGDTVVRGNTFYHQLFEAVRVQDNHQAVSILIENNTIDLTIQASAIFCYARSSPVIRNNIITRSAGGINCLGLSFPVIECNNLFAVPYPYPGECADQTGINGNISIDPQFCGVTDSGNYHLQGDSPCAAGNHPGGDDCGLIGAKGVACGTVPTKSMTWGQFKKLYDKKR